jgi:hypothetical protein
MTQSTGRQAPANLQTRSPTDLIISWMGLRDMGQLYGGDLGFAALRQAEGLISEERATPENEAQVAKCLAEFNREFAEFKTLYVPPVDRAAVEALLGEDRGAMWCERDELAGRYRQLLVRIIDSAPNRNQFPAREVLSGLRFSALRTMSEQAFRAAGFDNPYVLPDITLMLLSDVVFTPAAQSWDLREYRRRWDEFRRRLDVLDTTFRKGIEPAPSA